MIATACFLKVRFPIPSDTPNTHLMIPYAFARLDTVTIYKIVSGLKIDFKDHRWLEQKDRYGR